MLLKGMAVSAVLVVPVAIRAVKPTASSTMKNENQMLEQKYTMYP